MKYIENLFSLSGKVAIVTGAARGNGKAISESLLKAGASVLLVDILEKKLVETTTIFRSEKLDASQFICDIADTKSLNSLIKYIKQNYDKIDILVNNAGLTISGELFNYSLSDWEKTYRVNLRAPFELSKNISKIMKQNKSGSIINITSLNAELAFPDNPAYVAFKGALKQLTKSLAIDLGQYGIRANNVGPGYFKTEMTIKSWNDINRKNKINDKTILKRWGMPEDLAGIIIYLSSDASSYVTGQDIYIDGGWLAKGL